MIKNFSELNLNDVSSAGGKGASLGEMTGASIPVPPGFVILSSSFEDFLKGAKIKVPIEKKLQQLKDINADVVSLSQSIQKLILESSFPQPLGDQVLSSFFQLDCTLVAVRSSATAEDSKDAAWAGQLDSFLNVSKTDLLQRIKECWASLFTPRALAYRKEKNLIDTFISVAVVVQQMIQSEVSGIAFSVHPISKCPNEILIEAGFGLGEAVVSGEITPDSYVIDKDASAIISITPSLQQKKLAYNSQDTSWVQVPDEKQFVQKLSGKHILDLSTLIKTIEEHYQFPCDIEWAFFNDTFYIVQSRPITTL